MNYIQEALINTLKEFNRITSENISIDKVKSISVPLQEIAEALHSVINEVSFSFFNDKKLSFFEEIRANEKLSRDEFENKYSETISICEELGDSGWVVSEHANPKVIGEWYSLVRQNKDQAIADFFDEENGLVLNSILEELGSIFVEGSAALYYSKAKNAFEENDYMTSAMYAVALIEERTKILVDFPPKLSYSEKYSKKGFEPHLKGEFHQVGVFSKQYMFLEMYPSLIHFLKRLFVDGEYKFENKIEPPYINRNWLHHGKVERSIQRYECVQLFNALSLVEFLISINLKPLSE